MTTTAAASTVGEPFAAAIADYENEPALQTPDDAVSWREYAERDVQLQRAEEHLARVEQIKRLTLLAHDGVAGGHALPPTWKLKRPAKAAEYATEIEGTYTAS
jgi:long-chain acyl-CoA synthetase